MVLMGNNNGKTANSSGRHAESIIECILTILKRKGYRPVSQYVIPPDQLLDKPLTSDSVRVDVLVRGIPQYESGLIISSKRQDEDGTAAEKLYYHIDHLIKKCYPYPTILVLTGNRWPARLVEYAQNAKDGKLIKVFLSYEDLLRWVENVPPINHARAVNGYLKNLPLFGKKDDEKDDA